jgi:putative aldouronate transport system substrate-binding protein
MMDTLAAAFSLKVNTMYTDPQTGKITYWTEYNDGQNFKDYVTTARKWYAEGLLDPEYPSQNYDTMAAKITSDKAGMFFCFPDNVIGYTNSIANTLTEAGYADPEGVQIYGMVPLMGVDGRPYTYDLDNAMVNYAAVDQATVVTTGAEDRGTISKCLELINYLYSEEGSELNNWGVEGVSYTKDADGKKAWTELVTNDPDYGFGDAVFKYALPTNGGWPKQMSYEAWGSMNLVNPDAIILHQNYAKADKGLLLPTLSLSPEETEIANMIMTDVNTAVGEVYLSVIMGTKPVEDLGKLLAQVESMGVNEAIACWQAAYDRYLAK